jgi:hypothetical protein
VPYSEDPLFGNPMGTTDIDLVLTDAEGLFTDLNLWTAPGGGGTPTGPPPPPPSEPPRGGFSGGGIDQQ